jgi:hypothetical protein
MNDTPGNEYGVTGFSKLFACNQGVQQNAQTFALSQCTKQKLNHLG